MVAEYSVSPDGEKFYLPGPGDDEKEAKRLQAIVRDQRALGREIVVVMGVGFVGAAMAAVVGFIVLAILLPIFEMNQAIR